MAWWPDERTIWRWHFFAGLFCLPFVAWLSLTGTIYLFKPQVDAWIDWRFDHRPPVAAPADPVRIASAALAAEPGGRLDSYELPSAAGAVARVLVERHGEVHRVYVDPGSLAILKTVAEEDRFERLVFRLHGQLLLGNAGSVVIEMVASWTFVLVATGLYLWWPRRAPSGAGARGAGGVLYPRLRQRGRLRLRDIHAVGGMWVSGLLVLFLVSGLPWSFVWGNALQAAQHRMQAATAAAGWEIGASPAERAAPDAGASSMPGMDMPGAAPLAVPSLAGLDAALRTAARLDLARPVMVVPPARPGGLWRIRSDAQDRPRRETVTVSSSGEVVSRQGFAGRKLVDRVVGYGVAMHEGQLFGWANQLLNLVFALTLLTVSTAACLMWLRRRPPGRLGALPARASRRVGVGAIVAMVVLGAMLPELGVALLVVWGLSLRRREAGVAA